MNSTIAGIEEADVLLLVGTDLKQENPLLNARVLSAINEHNLKVFTIGNRIFFNLLNKKL